MATTPKDSRFSQSGRHGATVPVRVMRRFPIRIVGGAGVVGLVALALTLGASPAAPGAKASAERRPLGMVTSVGWSVRRPARARLVLRPGVTLNVQKRALRRLGARKPRVSGRFVVRIVTRPRRGRARTLAVRSRRVRAQRVRVASRRTLLGHRLRFRRVVFTRRQTARVKRAAKRQRLAVVASVRWRARYTDARGHRVVTPVRSARTTRPLRLRRPRAHGAKLRGLAVALRAVIRRVRGAPIACVTRDTIIGRLRTTYAALVSGDRTAAADLLRVWIADAESKAAAGVLTSRQARRLRIGLRAILARVGSGRSEPLRPVEPAPRSPRCAVGGARSARAHSSQVTIAAALKVAASAFKVIKAVKPVRTLKKLLWPDANTADPTQRCLSIQRSKCTSESIYDVMDKDAVSWAGQTLDGLSDDLRLVFAAEDSADYDSMKNYWNTAHSLFVLERSRTFQKAGSEVKLLPLFAQYENLYQSFLRYGVLQGAKMGFTQEYIRTLEDDIVSEQRDASDYATKWFANAVHAAEHYDDNQKQYASKNPVWVDKQLRALDSRDTWPLQSPLAYPFGNPDFRQQRMIYSDEWGRTHDSSNFPDFGMADTTGALTNPPMPNVSYLLSHFTAWLKQEFTKSYDPDGDYRNWLSAIKVDNAPVAGSITGDGSLSPNEYGAKPAAFGYDVAPGLAILEAWATWAEKNPLTYPQDLIQVLKLNFSDGSTKIPGGAFYNAGSRTRGWAYPDEVLATAKIMGRYEYTNNNYVGNAIVFGFRLDDSFAPPSPPMFGRVTPSSSSGMCLAVEQTTLQGEADYAHNGEQTGKRFDVAPGVGPAVQLYECNFAGWNGTATWETTWDLNPVSYPGRSPGDGELRVFGGTKCAAPDPTDTTPPIAVRVQDCDGKPGPQIWTPRYGSIVNTGSGQCLERSGLSNGSPLQLNGCNGSDAQKWSWPAGWNAQPTADTTPPAARLSAAPAQKAGRTIKLAVRATSEDMRATVSGKLAIRGSRKTYRLKGVSNRLIARGQRAALKLRLSKKAVRAARRALRQHRKVAAKLRIMVRDGVWNVSASKRTIRLTR